MEINLETCFSICYRLWTHLDLCSAIGQYCKLYSWCNTTFYSRGAWQYIIVLIASALVMTSEASSMIDRRVQ